MAAKRTKLKERYELRDVLGRGGMGVVYKALDTVMKREVALKTILDIDNPASADLFYKEWSILATMVHPNIVGIYDIGEFEEGGMKKPFFVMPLLPGVALDRLIRDGSPRLTTENVVNIIDQACRGLHAAHEKGLVHRDVKPGNIFVMDDDSVKIIDFGIARIASTQSKTGIKGTLFYLAPEFLELKPPTPLSDQFSLAVVAYEALTRRRPFDGASDAEVFEAIRRHSPPPASELNPNVNYAISQVIHKAMAKQPYHRFLTVREFGDSLQKARRNEPLELFDNSKIKPRLEKARLSFEQGDYNFALEILAELEAEGRLDPEVGLLRRHVDQAVRQTRIRQSLESARRFLGAEEYPLALRKIQDALDLDPEDTDALSLKSQIERERREKKIEEWIQIARQHLDNQAFSQARDALDNVLKLKPNDTVALAMVAEVGKREREVSQIREEKARLYQAAMQAWDKGDVTSALSKLEHLMVLDRDKPDADAGRTRTYHSFYNQVHSEHNSIKNAYEEARRSLSGENYDAALAICRQYLAKYPNHALFQALEFDIEERQRQALSAVIADTDRRVEAEADLDRRVGILEEVLKVYPGEPHFERALKLVHDKRDLVRSIISKARYFEERGQFNEALDQWQILRSIHERHPGLTFEIERLMKKRDQQGRENAKALWVQQTDRCLEAGDYERAVRTVESALAEFPGEPDLLELGNVARKGLARAGEALQLLARAREIGEKGALEASLDPLRQAADLDPRNSVIRTVLANSLLEDARRLMQIPDWEGAEARLKEILALDPNHAGAQSLASEIADRKRGEFVSQCITYARRLQAEGDIGRALAVVAQGRRAYPKDPRFEQLEATLQRAQVETQRQPAPRDGSEKAGTTPGAAKPPKTPEAPTPSPRPPFPDENVQFTVYRPSAVQAGRWHTLLAFMHLSERRPDAPPGEPDPLQEVQRQAASALGEDARRYRQVTEDSTQAVPREGEITFVPEVSGVEFSPLRRSFLWRESVHKEEFRMRAASGMEGQVARGRLTVFLGSIIIGDIPLSVRVGEREASQQLSATVAMYRKVFASYSHKDVGIVEEFERYTRALGDEYLRDMVGLKSGEVWDERLRKMIDDADVFQLFWSWNSIHSGFVHREWEYALSLGHKGPAFVRPVYWEEPLPADPERDLPPEKLRRLHFHRLRVFPEEPRRATSAGPAPAPAFSATAILGAAPAQPQPAHGPEPPRVSPPPPAETLPWLGNPLASPRTVLYAGAGLAAVLLVVVGAIAIARSRHRPPPKPVTAATFKVRLRAVPEGAAISVDGKPCGASTCELQLPPGKYQASAALAGYQNAATEFAVTADKGAPDEVRLILEAPPAQFSLSTDLTDGTLSVDGAPAAQIQGGEIEVPSLTPGQHKLEIQSSVANATLALDFTSGALPKLTEPVQARGVDAVIVSRYGAQAMVYCGTEGLPVTLDGKPAGAASAAGLELKDLAPGPHEIQMIINGLTRKIPFESSAASGVVASLLTERNVGSLRIVTGDDDVAIYLNGQKSTRATKRGRALLYLPPKQYVVRVEKPGLWAADQTVDVRRGEETPLTFKLVPAKGALEVHVTPAGTEVWLDDAQIGTARDGSFSSANIQPGKHTVALKKAGFKPIQGEYVFEPGRSIPVQGTLQIATGALKIEVSPAVIEGLQLHLRREGEAQDRVLYERELTSLPEGTYQVTATAPQYLQAGASAQVTAGSVATATLTMRRVESAPAPPKARAEFSMEEWVKAGGPAPSLSNWAREGKLWVKSGGGFVVAPVNPAAGSYAFTAVLIKGARLEWVLNYADDKNYDLFQLDDNYLARTQFSNGKKGNSVKQPASVKIHDSVSVTIAVTSSSVVHSFLVNQQWQVVDRFERPGGGLQGKFGFHVPAKDQIGVSEFRFTAN